MSASGQGRWLKLLRSDLRDCRPKLQRISNRIINEVPGINRVTLDISSKPPATIEGE